MIELPILDKAEANGEQSGSKLWRSLPHLKNDPAYQAAARNEFMPEAGEAPSGASRRQFLQLMGASMALAGLTGCRRPVEKILPYTRKPEEIIEGVSMYYATAMPFRGVVRGLLVESHEGRPTKVEGNPDHPNSRGATTVFEQASILNLYDPDRSRFVLRQGEAASWQDFVRLSQGLPAGARVAVLAEPTSSPTLRAMRDRLLQRFPGARWITYRPEGDPHGVMGLQLAAGRPLRPRYDFSEARTIVSLDADFLGPTEPDNIQNTRTFTLSRFLEGPQDEMSRLYVAESGYSLTGGKADHRLRVRASDVPALALALASRLGVGGGTAGPNAFADSPIVAAMAEDLTAAGSRGVVLAGDTQPPEIHALVASINAALGSTVVQYLDTGEETMIPQTQALTGLVNDMRAGAVDVLLMLDVNPVLTMPPAYGFAEALATVEHAIHVGPYVDETAAASRWHLPLSHYLEAWGDGRAYDGTLSVIQPLIAPLYDTRSEIEVLNLVATGVTTPGYELVREQWAGVVGGEEGWRRALHDGFVEGTAYPAVPAAAGAASVPTLRVPEADALEVVFHLDSRVLDGRYANNVWMVELPEQTTKLVWDNVAVMSPATAESLGLEVEYDAGKFYADVVELALDDRTVRLPVWIQPGVTDGTIHVTLGWGRNIASVRELPKKQFFNTDTYTDVYAPGPVANGVGVNVAPLRSLAFERVALGARVTKVDDGYLLVSTQEHGSMEGRPIVRSATLETFRQHPDFALDAVEPLREPWENYPSLWEENHPQGKPAFQDSLYYKNQWGMAIDLNKCTGCSACVIACVSENNIQMVGKKEVGRGREMHWLRLDRYFLTESEDVAEPRMVVQPMLCQHCENAPCEPVCPVAATSHSADGINEMTYNRCIGTRYCSNNCPYKVRRYNFFNWAKTLPASVEMTQNPNVTVRFRGVMEKCTYCVQRVREGQRQADIEKRPLRDREVLTACQQACPAEAIVFGDLNDPNSQVMQYKRNPRRYEVLGELNTQPRTSYLSHVWNPNPRLAPPAGVTPEEPAHH